MVYISDPVSAEWYGHDCNRDEISFLQKFKLNKGARVFDIGAHQGVIALIFSKIVGDTGNVISLEMDGNHVKKAIINKQINRATNLKILQMAVAEKSGTRFFNRDQIRTDNHIDNLKKVKSISIDNLTRKFGIPSLVYMDIEGYEYNALMGAKNTLRLAVDWCIEVHVKCGLEEFNGSAKKIISYFPKQTYNLYIASATDRCRFVQFSPNNALINRRFYLIAIGKSNKYFNYWKLQSK